MRSRAGVGMTPPNVPGAPKPASSVMISNTLGAPFGRRAAPTTASRISEAFRLMTPPKAGSGGGSCLPSIVVVAPGEPGTTVAVPCARADSVVQTMRLEAAARPETASWQCLPSRNVRQFSSSHHANPAFRPQHCPQGQFDQNDKESHASWLNNRVAATMGGRSARLMADATYDTAASYTENDARTGQEAQDKEASPPIFVFCDGAGGSARRALSPYNFTDATRPRQAPSWRVKDRQLDPLSGKKAP